MMYAGDHRQRINRARDSRAESVGNGDDPLNGNENPFFQGGEHGSENCECEITCHENRYQRGDKEIDHLGNLLMQLLLEEAHEPHGNDDRNDVSLIAGQVDMIQTEPDGSLRNLFPGFEHTRHAPRVGEVGMHHDHADDGSEEDVAAEHPRGGNGDQDGKEYESRVAEQMEDLIGAGIGHIRPDLGHAFQQTHHKTGGDDGRQDGNEHIAQRLDHAEGQGLLGGGGGLDVRLGGGGHAADREEFVIHLVDGACADNDLELAVGAENALDAVHIFELFHIYLAVVIGHQTKSCGAMRGRYEVFTLTHEIVDLLRAFSVIHKNTPLFYIFFKIFEHS